jgi:serine/threonine protein kinase/tetratricopeptide (TPR) repeat protein
MTPERWQQIEQLFHSALGQDRGERAAFLAQACLGDGRLHEEVESLLASHDQATSFIEMPAGDAAAELLEERHTRWTPGTMVNRYKILGLLGKGGMGEVYLAEDTELHRRIALKVLPGGFTRDSDRVRRFVQEAHAASALNHPNIITIHEIGRLDDTHFIVTEFIEGQTLREQFRSGGILLTDALDVAIQVASALDAAHAAGIVHRDIKPENIMVRHDGYIKVLDFGLAKLAENPMPSQDLETAREPVGTNPGIVMGTVNYMSPEQARGLDVDTRTDLWSLGVVLYEMVAGRVPFRGETSSHVVVSILESEPAPDSELPPGLAQIVTRTLCKDKNKRYQTAGELTVDLKSLKQDLEADARFENPLHPHRKGGDCDTRSNGHPAAETTNRSTEDTSDATEKQSTSSAEYLISEVKRHKLGAVLVAAALVIMVAGVVYSFYSARRGESVAPSGAAIDSIAVLPFVNVSADPNTEYLSDGISDSIINSLARLPRLKVMSLNSVLRYKGKQIDPQAVGRELNVRAVLMSRLVQQGDNLAISTELVDVRDNRRLWGEQYNRKLSDIIVVQTEIARDISENLRLRLSSQDKKQLAKRYTENTEAYLLYQQGRDYLRRRTRAGTEKGIECLEEAIKKDPAYALARAWLAYAYSDVSSPLPFKEVRQKVESLLLKALELDNDLAEAHAVLGGIRQDDGDWQAAERECKHAVDLDSSSVMAHVYYAGYLSRTGRHDEAIAETKLAAELDPLSVRLYADVGYQLYFARRYDQAIEQFKKTIDMDPNYAAARARLGVTYLQKGMYEEAIVELEKARALDSSPERPGRFAWPAYAYAVSGQRDRARRMLAELKEQARQRHIPPINFAIIYTGLGEKDQAFAWLEKVYEEGNGREIGEVRVNPMFDGLRSDPRYAELLRRVNLAP